MSISIHITGNTPAEVKEALAAMAAAMGGSDVLAARLVAAEVAPDQTSAKIAVTSSVAENPPKEPEDAPKPVEPVYPAAPATTEPATPSVRANVVKELSPAEMRAKGSDMLMVLFNRDPAMLPQINAIRSKYGVKKFGDVPDDQAQAFYADAMLLSNGTGEVAA